MKGDLYINDKDAYASWGVFLSDEAVSTLMTPAPVKDRISNNSALEHGVRYITGTAKVNERELTLIIYLRASSKAEFLTRYQSFCEELKTGNLDIRTKYQTDVVYRCIYQSCTSFSEFNFGLAKFSLKLTEPDPTDRALTT